MKHINRNIALGLVAVAFAQALPGTAVAQGPMGDRAMGRADFASLDRTGDGLLTAEDFEAAAEARFAEIDSDGNGEVSREEFIARARDLAGRRAERRFDRLDVDGDGVLSRDAVAGRGADRTPGLSRMLARFDANGDGGLDESEFETARAEMQDMRRMRREDGKGRNN